MQDIWAYDFKVIEDGESLATIKTDLNAFGQQGWELAAACQHPDPDSTERHQWVLFLKRRRQPGG